EVSDAWDGAPSDTSEHFTITSDVGVEGSGPLAFGLRPNRPNPFAGRTEIRYTLAQAAKVSLEVYDVKGARVALLVAGAQGPGEHSVSFGPGVDRAWRDLTAGMDFYRLRAGAVNGTRRMVLMH